MFARWIKHRREELEMTQDALAAALQLEGMEAASRTAVSAWENGRYSFPIKDPLARQALSRVLKVTVDEILNAAGFQTNEQISELALRAASIVDNLPPEKQNLAIDLLLALEKPN